MDEDQQIPTWANVLLQRITSMEQSLQSSPLVNQDPNVVIRAPGSDFTPTENMLEHHPYLQQDFFKRPLDENARRRFLFDCPKNSLRNYDPPKLNKVHLNASSKQMDAQLSNIQYRLSGITRPLDWFTYQLHHGEWTQEQLKKQSMDLTHAIHELLSDLASHITTLRTDNMFRGLPSNIEPPAPPTDNFLVETQVMLDHIKLQQSVQNATQQRRNNNKRINGPRPNNRTNNGINEGSNNNNYTKPTPGYNNNQSYKPKPQTSHSSQAGQQVFQPGPSQQKRH